MLVNSLQGKRANLVRPRNEQKFLQWNVSKQTTITNEVFPAVLNVMSQHGGGQ
jgi:hypothetical protein